ncbi:hypothetical protein [Engelhardtia mirabilis]|uniref:HEAT repeat domain-containing protein n=1 Tax=Engelhardtia mirabilis TaxID=2528011 RepID=A0A518BQL6_9BACT|nr:hypothetical protein Pla133_43780 [Planctomycetes bacterium Pla133]QDV03586.1 hypothetical protein Pla86_43770 [Planctomycetes bacterium Pla86]
MLTALTLALLVSLAPAQEETPPPTPEQVELAVSAIESGLEEHDLEATLAAIEAAKTVPHEDVTEALGEAARTPELEIGVAALDALGRIEHDSAVAELKKVRKKAKKLLDEEAWAIELWRAMGRRGDAELIDELADGSVTAQHFKVDRARILALGKIRSPKSVEALMDLMKRIAIKEVNGFMDPFRASLGALTGQDAGHNRPLWQAWWNDNKRSLALPEEEAVIENKKIRVVWEGFWKDRKQKDDEGDGGR